MLGESAVDPGDPGDPVVAARAELAKTGASSLGLLLAAGLALLLLGAVLIGIGRASEVLGSDG
ncbi:MAG TPA: LPXTG cell wall anchor domain-containing protein [Acidimicrobiales bacterium]|nr:LPXTG cell wall anchor domain-containing protein [Acidimicrobiales bacterium]